LRWVNVSESRCSPSPRRRAWCVTIYPSEKFAPMRWTGKDVPDVLDEARPGLE
jgi:hypothetical protein